MGFTLLLREAVMLCIGSLCLSVGKLVFNSTSTGKPISFARRTNLVREALQAKLGRMPLMLHITTQQGLGECEQHEGVFLFLSEMFRHLSFMRLSRKAERGKCCGCSFLERCGFLKRRSLEEFRVIGKKYWNCMS